MADLILHDEPEIWKISPSFSDYEISSLGRVRRLKFNGSGAATGKVLRGATNHHSGYPHLILSFGGKSKTVKISKLVCETFHGPAPSQYHEVAHWDGDTKNNQATNLRWATKYENAADRKRHGTNSHPTRLSLEIAREIRKKRYLGSSYSQLVTEFAVDSGHIRQILRGKIWKEPNKDI